MQRSPLLTMTLRAGALVFAALMPASAGAAELGDISVRSYIGQQLAADIELVSLTPDDINGLQVRLAQQNVYQGANITMNPALAGVHMSVVRREQRQFLHITTLQPVEAEYVHLFLELNAGSRHEVRAATLWLQPDPHPAPPPAPVPMPIPAAAAAAPSDAALIAARARARAGRPAAMAKAAPVDAAEAASEPKHEAPAATRKAVAPKELAEAIAAKLPGARVMPKKDAAAHAAASAAASAASSAAPAAAALPPVVAKTPPLKGAAAPAACAPQSGITSKECAALDEHNAALSTKLVELEGKLKVLQMAVASKAVAGEGVAAKPAAPAAAPASAHASAAASAPASASAHASASASAVAKMSAASAAAKALATADAALGLPPAPASASASAKTTKVLPKLKYKKEKPDKPADTGMKTGTMVAIGAGVLALLGGLGWWLMKRRKAKGSAPLKIWQGWRKKKAAQATPEPAQPLHEVTPESLLEPE